MFSLTLAGGQARRGRPGMACAAQNFGRLPMEAFSCTGYPRAAGPGCPANQPDACGCCAKFYLPAGKKCGIIAAYSEFRAFLFQ